VKNWRKISTKAKCYFYNSLTVIIECLKGTMAVINFDVKNPEKILNILQKICLKIPYRYR